MKKEVYSIGDVAQLTGFSESTLRYYETIGLIPRISRDKKTGRRTYNEGELQFIDSLACLAQSGMSLGRLREYVKHREKGVARAVRQVALFREQEQRFKEKITATQLQLEYIRLKVAYWQAVDAGDKHRVIWLSQELRGLARGLKLRT